MRYSCTKCSKKFSVISSLHAHILDCASEGKKKVDSSERAYTKYVFKKGLGRISIQSKKIPSASQMKLKAAIGFQKKVGQILNKVQNNTHIFLRYLVDIQLCERKVCFLMEVITYIIDLI